MNTNPTPEQEMSAEDLTYIETRAAELKAEDKRRYDRVIAEIDKDEREARERLHQIQIRRAIVTKVGHYG